MSPNTRRYWPDGELIELLMEEERRAMELYHRNADCAADPELRSVFQGIAAKRREFYKSLEMQLVEIQSKAEVTTQINSMFW